MMDNNVNASSRKSVVCRYFAASGTCFYGNDCQFLHSAVSRFSISPTFPSSVFSSPAKSNNSRASDSPSELVLLESSRSIQTSTHPMAPLSSMSALKDGLAQVVQEISTEHQLGRPAHKPTSFDFEVEFQQSFVFTIIFNYNVFFS